MEDGDDIFDACLPNISTACRRTLRLWSLQSCGCAKETVMLVVAP